MAHEKLSAEEQNILKGCLDAIASEVFIDAEEFETLAGVDFDDFCVVQKLYPEIDDSDEMVALCLHGALLNLLFYPHHQQKRWQEFIAATPQEVFALHQKWMTLKGWKIPSSEGGMYFFDLLQ